jgi:2-C-methyl-D-erythritol 2,4-cyclodiphosphate synthase
LILGGIKIPHTLGLEGHSDADVLTHAVIDALIGALGRGDIGQHFPDTDPAYKDADSIAMLKRVMTWVEGDGFRVNNLDATIIAERPKLGPFIGRMRERLSKALETSPNRTNIKATTTEGLGFCGREEGMEAFAVVTLVGDADQG